MLAASKVSGQAAVRKGRAPTSAGADGSRTLICKDRAEQLNACLLADCDARKRCSASTPVMASANVPGAKPNASLATAHAAEAMRGALAAPMILSGVHCGTQLHG
jgi:hypothetical protein